MLQRIDDFIIAQFERFTHWTQRTVGIRARHWAIVCLVFAAVYVVKAAMIGDSIVRYFAPFLFLEYFARHWIINRRASQCQLNDERTMNPEREYHRVIIRFVTLVIFLTVIVSDVRKNDLWYEFGALSLWLMACDDLPASPSRLRQWLDSLRKTPVTATEAV